MKVPDGLWVSFLIESAMFIAVLCGLLKLVIGGN